MIIIIVIMLIFIPLFINDYIFIKHLEKETAETEKRFKEVVEGIKKLIDKIGSDK